MWLLGEKVEDIASAMGVSRLQIKRLASRNRDMFPPRDFRAKAGKIGLVSAVPTSEEPLHGEKYEHAKRLWSEGAKILEIAAAIGITRYRLIKTTADNRKDFPRRGERRSKYGDNTKVFIHQPVPKAKRANVMEWVTQCGAVVTLPRISLIECPRVRA